MMILIFGGTTEGRVAAEVLESAGKPYYYSTRGEMQNVTCPHALRLTGGMDTGEILAFCREQQIRLLVDAAHPFATTLHHNIAKAAEMLDIPVIRYERIYPPRNSACLWYDTYEEAIAWLEEHAIHPLLALSGVQTIARLKPYWIKYPCWFRILNRKESLELARQQDFPEERLVYYEKDQVADLLEQIQPGAILTKESGESGFFEEKTRVALEWGIPVLVIKRPPLPEGCYVVTGKHGLRHRIERLLPGFFPLKTGYTTGSCACAAAKAALITLTTGKIQSSVRISLPCGEEVELPVSRTVKTTKGIRCSVVKDAGDDPDVTHGQEINAEVWFSAESGIRFCGGKGVGKITLPGLGLAIGEPAINPVPREMMKAETEKVLTACQIRKGIVIEISVPEGEELATRTFNPKLGITGGISIIGTSGVVQPFSLEAFLATIRKEIQVAKALECRHLILNSGAKSERMLRERFPELPSQAFIHYGNYIGESLRIAREEEVEKLTLGIMIGKAVKLAEGNMDTHSRNVVMNREFIATLARECGCSESLCNQIREMPLARELWNLLPPEHPFFTSLTRKCLKVCAGLFPENKLQLILIPENTR